jgi:hypothetical protein
LSGRAFLTPRAALADQDCSNGSRRESGADAARGGNRQARRRGPHDEGDRGDPPLSEKTVEHHRANAMRKLGMRDRVELVRYAIRRGLIEP